MGKLDEMEVLSCETLQFYYYQQLTSDFPFGQAMTSRLKIESAVCSASGVQLSKQIFVTQFNVGREK